MTLSFNQARILIYAILAALIFSAVFGFTILLPVQKAHAQFGIPMPVLDPAVIAALQAIAAQKEITDSQRSLWESVKEWNKTNFFQVRDWIKKNAIAIIIATGAKIAAKWMLKKVQKLVQDQKIESFLYWGDFLARNVYAVEHITKNFEGQKQTQFLLLSLIKEGELLYGQHYPGSTVREEIRNRTLLKEECQTSNLNPSQPDYYIRLLETKSFRCVPDFAIAGY